MPYTKWTPICRRPTNPLPPHPQAVPRRIGELDVEAPRVVAERLGGWHPKPVGGVVAARHPGEPRVRVRVRGRFRVRVRVRPSDMAKRC